MTVADAHVHYFSRNFFRLLGREDAPSVLGWTPADDDLAAVWDEELERNAVSRAAIIASLPGDEQSVLDAVKSFPQRFYGYFMVNPLAADAPDRVRSFTGQGMRAVCLFPAMHRYSMHDDRVSAVLDAAPQRTVIFVHCGVLSVGIRKRLALPSPFDLRYSNPLDLHEVALRYPGLTFTVPHFGAGMFREALMLADLCPNVYLDTSSSNSWMRYEGLTLDQVFARSLEVVGSTRLLFGTDSSFFPRGWNHEVFEAQLEAVRRLGADEDAIFGGNLIRLLG